MWKTLDPVRSEHGLTILPMATLRRAVAAVRYVVSGCTGALVLGAAGLLRGRRAGTHWMSRDLLRAFGAEPVAERVVVDGNIFTGRGVTAGIDVALAVAAEIASRVTAETIQLDIEYEPALPFASGSPETDDPAVVLAGVLPRAEPRQRDRAEWVAHAAATLG